MESIFYTVYHENYEEKRRIIKECEISFIIPKEALVNISGITYRIVREFIDLDNDTIEYLVRRIEDNTI